MLNKKKKANKNQKDNHTSSDKTDQTMNLELTPELQHIQTWLAETKFKKTMFGGVKESDVWKKISELNALYDQALTAERVRYDTLLKDDHERMQKAAQEYCRKYVEKLRRSSNGGTQ